MSDAPARFVRALAAAVLGEGEGAARAAEARAALDEAFAARKSLVLDVQFTGFTDKGQIVGGVDPVLLRAAGHLITLRVARVGFTPQATAAELEDVFRALSLPAAALGEGGIAGRMAEIAPRGVYLATVGGGGYKPAPRAAAPEDAPKPGGAGEGRAAAGEGTPPAAASAAAAWTDEVEATELAEFELVDEAGPLAAPVAEPAPAAPAASTPAAGGGGGGGEEPPSSDMYHFFRAAGGGDDAAAEELPRLLRQADNANRFDELAEQTARMALALVRSDAHGQAVDLLDALVREAERPDRTRFFREAAVQALRRTATADTLHRLLDLLPQGPPAQRDRILRFFVFTGADALPMLEGMLFRAGDAELRGTVLRALLGVPGTAERLMAHAVEDPGPVKARTLLELATGPGVDGDVARRWAGEAAAHRDPAVRAEAARAAASLGGRAALRTLVDLLGDREAVVRREAVQGLGALGDAAAVPFLARALNEGDEELQAAAAAALGRIGSGEALPPLLGVVQKRSLFSGKKATRLKAAALQAIARIDTPAAREALSSIAAGRDDLADEARRLIG